MTKSYRFNSLVPLLSAGIFTILASLNLRATIWFDEAYSAYLIRGNFAQIWQMTALDVHPPFYYFCLKVWSLLFGTSDIALRSMSIFFGVIAIFLAFALLRRLFTSKHAKTAELATFALAISPIFVRYSQEMRMYTLVFTIILSATLVLDYALKQRHKCAWFTYAILLALGMLTHYFTALAWLAHLAYIIYYFRQHGLQKAVFWTYPLSVLGFAPWLPSFFTQLHSVQSGFWIPSVNLSTPLSFFSESLTLYDATSASNWLFVPILALLALATYLFVRFRDRRSPGLRFLLCLIFLPPLFLILLSLPPFQPTYMTRYVMYSATLLWPLLGLIIAWSHQRGATRPAYLLVVLALICSAIGLIQTTTRDNQPDARDINTVIQTANSPVAVLAHVDAMDYYNLFFYETPNYPVYAFDADIIWGSLEPIRSYQQNYLPKTALANFLDENDRFWLILPTETKNDYSFTGFHATNSIKTEKFIAQEYLRQ